MSPTPQSPLTLGDTTPEANPKHAAAGVPPKCPPMCRPQDQPAYPARPGAGPAAAPGADPRPVSAAGLTNLSDQRGRGMAYEDRLQKARQALVVVGVDCGKEKHALVVFPQAGPDAYKLGKPVEVKVSRAGFEKAEAVILAALQRAGGAAAGGAPGEDGPAVRARVLVGLEFGGPYGMTFAYYLAERGYDVVSVRPKDTNEFTEIVHRRTGKTDEKDAQVIARLTADGNYLGFPFLRPEFAELRQLVSAVDRTTKARSAAVTRVRGALQLAWPEYERTFRSFTKTVLPLGLLAEYATPDALLAAGRDAVIAAVDRISNGQKGAVLADTLLAGAGASIALPGVRAVAATEIPFLLEQIALANRQRAALEKRLAAVVKTLPEGEALMTIPGVKALTAAVFFGSVGDVRSYASSRQVLALAGLNLKVKSSGKTQGAPHISKQGRPMMRRYLFLAAVRLVSEGQPYHEWFEAAKARNGGKGVKAAIGVARKLLRVMYAVARSGEPYDRTYVATDGAAAARRA